MRGVGGCERGLRGLTPEDRGLLGQLAEGSGSWAGVLWAGMAALVKKKEARPASKEACRRESKSSPA